LGWPSGSTGIIAASHNWTHVLHDFALRCVYDRQASTRTSSDYLVGIDRVRIKGPQCKQGIAKWRAMQDTSVYRHKAGQSMAIDSPNGPLNETPSSCSCKSSFCQAPDLLVDDFKLTNFTRPVPYPHGTVGPEPLASMCRIYRMSFK
jgi:hypothetical protein